MVVGEVKERLYISEPGGAFAVECDCAKTLRSLLTNLLTISSLLLSGSNNVANAAHYLQKQIGKLNEKIVSVRFSSFLLRFPPLHITSPLSSHLSQLERALQLKFM